MSSQSNGDVIVREVGLRDGLQILRTFVPTQIKQDWCTRAAQAGFSEMEVTSFVPSRYIPQFADAEAMVSHARGLPGLVASVLAPNLRGAERAIAAKAEKIICIVSVSESFNRANVKRSRQESIDDLRGIVELSACAEGGPAVAGGVSSAFGCTIEGRVAIGEIVSVVEALLEIGVDEVTLADTTGYGDPVWVREVVSAVSRLVGPVPLGVHLHDTRGTGLANALVALECGVRLFDASLGGIGGCPNSPGATGNIACEDLVYMLEAMGLRTGIDIEGLLELRRDLGGILPDVPLHGHMIQSGLPRGFTPAAHL